MSTERHLEHFLLESQTVSISSSASTRKERTTVRYSPIQQEKPERNHREPNLVSRISQNKKNQEIHRAPLFSPVPDRLSCLGLAVTQQEELHSEEFCNPGSGTEQKPNKTTSNQQPIEILHGFRCEIFFRSSGDQELRGATIAHRIWMYRSCGRHF